MDIALTMERGLAINNQRPLEGGLDFLAARSRRSARDLPLPAEEVFKGASTILDQLLTSCIEVRSSAEFRQAFQEVFPKYSTITLSLSQLTRAIVPHQTLERLNREAICELEADFRAKALLAFGQAAKDQAIFTIWTLRKINDLLDQIWGTEINEQDAEQDNTFALNFTFYSLRAHFSLDCLSMALRLDRAIYPEVMEDMKDCLRSMVNAYAWARQGAALRIPAVDVALSIPEQDEEEEELLRSSMQDMAVALGDESY